MTKPKNDTHRDGQAEGFADPEPATEPTKAAPCDGLASLTDEGMLSLQTSRCAIETVILSPSENEGINRVRAGDSPAARVRLLVELLKAADKDMCPASGLPVWLDSFSEPANQAVIGPYMADVMRLGTVAPSNQAAVDDLAPDKQTADGIREIARILNQIR